MPVSTRANWKEQVDDGSSQPSIAPTDVSSPLSDPPDEDESFPDAPSPPTTNPSEVEANASQTGAELESTESFNVNQPAAPISSPLTNDASVNNVGSHDLPLTQASYTDFLGELSLLPTSSLSPSAATTNDDQVFIAVSLLTPIGSRLTYYSNPLNWSLFRPHPDKPSQITSEADIIQSLYLNASYANKRSVLLLEDPRYIKAQVKKMFLTKPDSKQPDYAHVQLQVAVLDRFVWSNLPFQTTDIHRLAAASKSSNVPEHVLPLISSCQEWQKTLSTAATNFLVHETTENDSTRPSPSNDQQADGAVVTLGTRLGVSKNDSLVSHVEQNLISAAIGLRALAEVYLSLIFFAEINSSSISLIFAAPPRT